MHTLLSNFLLSKIKSKHVSLYRFSIFERGRIFDGEIMAESRPTLQHSCKNTEFNVIRAAGDSPKLIFEIPRTI